MLILLKIIFLEYQCFNEYKWSLSEHNFSSLGLILFNYIENNFNKLGLYSSRDRSILELYGIVRCYYSKVISHYNRSSSRFRFYHNCSNFYIVSLSDSIRNNLFLIHSTSVRKIICHTGATWFRLWHLSYPFVAQFTFKLIRASAISD